MIEIIENLIQEIRKELDQTEDEEYKCCLSTLAVRLKKVTITELIKKRTNLYNDPIQFETTN